MARKEIPQVSENWDVEKGSLTQDNLYLIGDDLLSFTAKLRAGLIHVIGVDKPPFGLTTRLVIAASSEIQARKALASFQENLQIYWIKGGIDLDGYQEMLPDARERSDPKVTPGIRDPKFVIYGGHNNAIGPGAIVYNYGTKSQVSFRTQPEQPTITREVVLKIPQTREINLGLHTDEGDLLVEGGKGSIQADSIRGMIFLRDHDGSFNIETLRGDIQVRGDMIGNNVIDNMGGRTAVAIRGSSPLIEARTSGSLSVRGNFHRTRGSIDQGEIEFYFGESHRGNLRIISERGDILVSQYT